MTREPGGLAQLAAAIAAVLSYALVRYLGVVEAEEALLAPLVTYAAAQIAGWLWARRQTTPVASPQLPAGTQVVVTDAKGEPESTQTLT
jgi:hypothetical protein